MKRARLCGSTLYEELGSTYISTQPAHDELPHDHTSTLSKSHTEMHPKYANHHHLVSRCDYLALSSRSTPVGETAWCVCGTLCHEQDAYLARRELRHAPFTTILVTPIDWHTNPFHIPDPTTPRPHLHTGQEMASLFTRADFVSYTRLASSVLYSRGAVS